MRTILKPVATPGASYIRQKWQPLVPAGKNWLLGYSPSAPPKACHLADCSSPVPSPLAARLGTPLGSTRLHSATIHRPTRRQHTYFRTCTSGAADTPLTRLQLCATKDDCSVSEKKP